MAVSKSFWEAEINGCNNMHIKGWENSDPIFSFDKMKGLDEIIREIFLKTLEHVYNFYYAQ